MIFTTFQEMPLALCLLEPDWSSKVKLSLTLPSQVDRSLGGNESRRAFAASMRYELSYTALTMTARETTDLRAWLDRLRDTRAAVPLWTDRVWLASPSAAGSKTLAFSDETPARWGRWWVVGDGADSELVEVASVSGGVITLAGATSRSWPASAWAAPLLFGRLAKRPELRDETDEAASVSLTFTENSPWSLRISPAPGSIPSVGASVPEFANMKLLAAPPDFAEVRDSSEEDTLEETIGFLREEQRVVYPARPRMKVSYSFTGMARREVADVERLWTDRLGVVRLFLAPTWLAAARLDRDTAAGGDTLHIEPSRYTDSGYLTRPGQPLLALLNGERIRPARVTTVSGSTLTLAAPLADGCAAADTVLSPLILTRFSETKLEWNYETDTVAKTTVKLIESPEEYATGAVDLPVPAFCYKFAVELPMVQSYRFTSHERPVTVSGDGTYEPAPFTHSGSKHTARLSGDELTLTSWAFDGNPLNLFFPFQLEKPLKFELREVNADTGAAKLIYLGEVKKCELDGRKIKATAVSISAMLERRFPRFYIQSSCNYTLFSPPCKLIADNYRLAVQLTASADGQTVTVSGLPASGLTENYFAGGYLITGELAGTQWRGILASAASSGGAPMTLTLNRPLTAWRGGQQMFLYPGCDGLAKTCKEKFNNYINFGGHAFVPNSNPTLTALPNNSSGGGKK